MSSSRAVNLLKMVGADYMRRLRGRHLLLQPHLDDIPFSLGHLLEAGLLNKCDYGVWTMFGKEFFNIRLYAHDEHTVSILMNEERRWFESEGHPINRLDLEEAGYRGVTGVRRLFRTNLYQDANLDYEGLGYGNWPAVVEAVREIVQSGASFIWAPAGIGGHCDHLALRQAVIYLAKMEPGIRGLLFYHELPYSQYSRTIEWGRFVIDGFQMEGCLEYHPTEPDTIRKTESISIFFSQITDRQAYSLSKHSEKVAVWTRRMR